MEEIGQNLIVTVDVAVFSLDPAGGLCVLLPPRPSAPFPGVPALPGVYVRETDVDTTAAARRALRNKAGLELPYLEQLYTFSGPARDQRGWSVSIAYYALVPWVQLSAAVEHMIEVGKLPSLPFDHQEIVNLAIVRLRSKSSYSPLALHLLPAEFTLTALQHVYEQLTGAAISRTTFRTRMLESDMIVPVGRQVTIGAHRPAALYRGKPF